MTVRNATFEDMALAADIMVISFRTAFAAFVSPKTMDAYTNPENCRAMLEHIYQEGKMHFLMGGDQGFLCWQETEEDAEIMAIHSLPESWGTGLGHAMMTEALKQIGDRPVYLWAFKENTRARRFYEKHGFRWDGTERVSEFDGALEVRYVKSSKIRLVSYSEEYYQAVCDFLIALNSEKKHINWNWARWEWMYAHPYCDRERLHTIGLWLDGDTVVGEAVYDLFHGEAFCGALDGYEALLPEILEYAYANLKDENRLSIAVRDDDIFVQEQLVQMGYHKAEQTEPILHRDLNEPLGYQLPAGFSIRKIHFPEDNLAYQTVIWKGFDHEGDQAELEKMMDNKTLPPNRRSELCLAVVDEHGEFAAHCTCWYDERTDYAYVEPVCTIPKYRGMGLGKAVVLEALHRCNALGAKQAFVISGQAFYKKLGFLPHSQYIFFKKI